VERKKVLVMEESKKPRRRAPWKVNGGVVYSVLGCPLVSTGRRRRRRLIKEERGDTDEARWSERGGNAEEACIVQVCV